MIWIGCLETLHRDGLVFRLVKGPVLVGVGPLQVPSRDRPAQLLFVKCAVVVGVERVEACIRCLFDLIQAKGPIVIRIPLLNERIKVGGRALL